MLKGTLIIIWSKFHNINNEHYYYITHITECRYTKWWIHNRSSLNWYTSNNFSLDKTGKWWVTL